MILISRYINYDKHLKMYALVAFFDGENETLVFTSKAAAEHEQAKLLREGAEYLPPQLDGPL